MGLQSDGYVSAVESYLRRLVVELIHFDEVARDLAASRDIPFGATLCDSTQKESASAILDTKSLASRNEVLEVLKSLLGIKNVRDSLETLLSDYQAICEIRHCCVHRFGKLGSKNAIALGLASHGRKVGAGFTVDPAGFEKIAIRLRTFVKGVNNVVWERVMERTATNRDDQGRFKIYSTDWTWNWQKDRKRFTGYWEIFRTQDDAVPSKAARELYDLFRTHHRPSGSGSRPTSLVRPKRR